MTDRISKEELKNIAIKLEQERAIVRELVKACKATVQKVMKAGFEKTCLVDTGIEQAIAKAEGR